MKSLGEARAEERAEGVIRSLGIVDPAEIAIEDIAMVHNALVVDGGLTGAEARLTGSPKMSFIRVNANISEPGRRRFGIAHEMGHLLLHREQASLSVCAEQGIILFQAQDYKELEANCFAAVLLMPATMYQPRCNNSRPSLDLARDLAAEFQVTLTAAAMRYIEYCPHRCCLVVSTDGRVRYHRSTTDFGYFLRPGEQVRSTSYAADLFDRQAIPTGMRSVPASAWLDGPRLGTHKRMQEHSIPMPRYNSVLSLLWIDSDIDRCLTGDDEGEAEQEASDSRWSWNRYGRRSG